MVRYLSNKPSILNFLLLIGLLSAIAKSHDVHWWQKSYQIIGYLSTYALIITYSAEFVMDVIIPERTEANSMIKWALGSPYQQ